MVAFIHPRGNVQVLVVVAVKISGRRTHRIDRKIQSHPVRVIEEVAVLCLLIILVLKTQSIPNEIQIQQTVLIEVHPLALKILQKRLSHRKVKRNLFKIPFT